MLWRRDNSDQAHRLKNSVLPEDIHIAAEESVKEALHLSPVSVRSVSKTWIVCTEKLRDKSLFHTLIAEYYSLHRVQDRARKSAGNLCSCGYCVNMIL